jgi:phage terminase large subunit
MGPDQRVLVLANTQAQMTPEQYAQEYLCSFDAAILGAYYGKEIAQLEREGRVTKVERVPDVAVYTAWDLGISDNGMMAIWVFRCISGQVRALDFSANSGFGFEHHVGLAQRS